MNIVGKKNRIYLQTTEISKVLVDKGEAPELIPLHVVEDVGGRGIWRCGGYGQLLELGVKVFSFARVRLVQGNICENRTI